MLTNRHHPPAMSRFCDDHENTLKLAIILNYNTCKRYVDESDHMIYAYSINTWIWKWM
jgi:hypothetical protein